MKLSMGSFTELKISGQGCFLKLGSKSGVILNYACQFPGLDAFKSVKKIHG
jgi:hypothetical protein